MTRTHRGFLKPIQRTLMAHYAGHHFLLLIKSFEPFMYITIKGKLRWNLFCLLYQFFSFKNNTCLVKNKIESPGFRLYHVQDHLKVVWTKRLIESFRSISSSHEINNNQRLILLQQKLVKSLLGNIKAAIWLAYSNFYVNSYSNQKHALS